MYNKKIYYVILNFLKAISALFLFAAFFFRPEIAIDGIKGGLNICTEKLIPSLFPFFIISGLFMSSELSKHGGIILWGYTKLLRIKSKKAASGILLGLIGGFASAGAIVVSLYNENELSKSECELFLCVTAAASPAFVINTVGYGMLGSSAAGIILYASILISNLITGLIVSIFLGKQNNNNLTNKPKENITLYEIIQSAVQNMLSLCGFVVAFCFISAVCVPPSASVQIKYFVCALLEVTIGCVAASQLHIAKIYFVCASLSVLGLCAILQMQAFCKNRISLTPFIISRFIHLPLSLLVLKLLLQLVPLEIQVQSFEQFNVQSRLPADTFVAFFLLLIAFFSDFKPLSYLRKNKNKV